MCDIIFENSKGLGGTVNRKSGYAEATKKFLREISQNSQENFRF